VFSGLKRVLKGLLPQKRKPPQLVMTLLLRDEQDIVRANIEFHLAQGVDFFIAMDNKSVDSTTEILKEYEQRGVLHYIYQGDDDYNQSAWVTQMAKLAATEFDATWVINNDADEFWWPVNQPTLKEELEALPADVNMVEGDRYNFVPVEGSAEQFASKMIYREKVSLNPRGNPLPPKVAHRGIPGITVGQGNHSVWGFKKPKAVSGVIDIQHFPLRSYAQFENKIVKGGQAYERNPGDPKNTGVGWRRLYEEYKQGNLPAHYKQEEYSPERLKQGLESGELLVEERLPTLLKGLNIKDNMGL